MVQLESQLLGEGWLLAARAILKSGALTTYEGETTRELGLVTLVVVHPSSDDPVIARLGDAEWLGWMHENFFLQKDVAELGGAQSYAVRLFNYERAGRDQIAWVVERLRTDPECRSATITTFQPLTDTTYVPCVSLLDFWMPAGALELVVYAHSLDFGKKAYGNLVELAPSGTRRSRAEHFAWAVGRACKIGPHLRARMGPHGPARRSCRGFGLSRGEHSAPGAGEARRCGAARSTKSMSHGQINSISR